LAPEESQIIGITGGIGSGKSRVCRHLARFCQIPVIDLDEICRQLLLSGHAGWQVLRTAIDKKFFLPSGDLNRELFREDLFLDKGLRRQVDKVLHPLAQKEMRHQVGKKQGMVLVEIPLLFEAGWQDMVDFIVVVSADETTRVQRIVLRDQVTEEQARLAIRAQLPLEEKASKAHYVVANSRSWEKTCQQLNRLAEVLGCRE